jgi:hypothetical protein
MSVVLAEKPSVARVRPGGHRGPRPAGAVEAVRAGISRLAPAVRGGRRGPRARPPGVSWIPTGGPVANEDLSNPAPAEGVAFNSPSAAAAVAFGGDRSGARAWRTEDGAMTDRDWQEATLKQAGVKVPGG